MAHRHITRGTPLASRGYRFTIGAVLVLGLVLGGLLGLVLAFALAVAGTALIWPVRREPVVTVLRPAEPAAFEEFLDYGQEPRVVYHQPAPPPSHAYVVEVETGEVVDSAELTPAARRLLEATGR